MKQIEITILVQLNDHDGYCSGAENEYTEEIKSYYMDVPEEYKDHPIGTNLTDYYFNIYSYSEYPESWIPVIKADGSGYCENSQHAEKHGLNKHDYKISIGKAIIVDIYNKINSGTNDVINSKIDE